MADVTTREYTLLDLVVRADPEHYDRDVCYRFTNGREFVDDDNTDEGIYDP